MGSQLGSTRIGTEHSCSETSTEEMLGGGCVRSAELAPAECASLASTFKVLGDPTRLRIFSLLASDTTGSIGAGDLQRILEVSQPTVSHHLKKLHQAGLILRSQQGRKMRYTVSAEECARLAHWLCC